MDIDRQPIDPTSAAVLSAGGLRLGLVDTSDREAFIAWHQADARGFYGDRLTQEQLEERLTHTAYRRTTGVWDETAPAATSPVATVSTWATRLTVPGRAAAPGGTTAGEVTAAGELEAARSVQAWAISSVTVAPTHRRRGIARALLEAELRTAGALGVPVAALTASEATIYGRFGFAPAAFASRLSIDTRRTRWVDPAPAGRLRFADLAELRDLGRAVFDASARRVPGEIELDEALWRDLTGALDADEADARRLRAVVYEDVHGTSEGFVLYRVVEDADDFSKHTVEVWHLAAGTDDAYAALWRYLLELDLVATVTAQLRSVDEPVLWQIGDRRAATVTTHDHLWLRILDAGAALGARGYAAPGRVVFEVDDPLGFTAGSWMLSVGADGAGVAERFDGEAPAETAAVALGVEELAALYLGGVSASTLARAGRITEVHGGSADLVDAMFRSPVTPWLNTWF